MSGDIKQPSISQQKMASVVHSPVWMGRKFRPEDMKLQDIDRIAAAGNRRKQSSAVFSSALTDDLKALPLLVETPINEREALFLSKVHMCCNLFDFDHPTEQVKSKEIKRLTLVELAEYISLNQHAFTEAIYRGLTELLRSNAFRVFPPVVKTTPIGLGEDEDEYTLEPSWPHLQLVYETFLRFVSSPDFQATLAKKHIDHQFLTSLLQLFDSEDPREREYVKTILHRIYGKLIGLRLFIRRQIDNIFLRFIYEEDGHNGIAELLDILDSIINGFQIPLKEEHKTFLRRVLLPLHKSPTLGSFHLQLVNCVTEFIKKDQGLFTPIIMEGLLRFWPRVSSTKEVLFINELEACLECASSYEVQSVIRPVFTQLAKCINSQHFQVAERALFLWSNEYLLSMMSENINLILPIVYPSLNRAKLHWNKIVHGLVCNAINWFVESDQRLVEECAKKLTNEQQAVAENERKTKIVWERIEAAASAAKLSVSSAPPTLGTRLSSGAEPEYRNRVPLVVKAVPPKSLLQSLSESQRFNLSPAERSLGDRNSSVTQLIQPIKLVTNPAVVAQPINPDALNKPPEKQAAPQALYSTDASYKNVLSNERRQQSEKSFPAVGTTSSTAKPGPSTKSKSEQSNSLERSRSMPDDHMPAARDRRNLGRKDKQPSESGSQSRRSSLKPVNDPATDRTKTNPGLGPSASIAVPRRTSLGNASKTQGIEQLSERIAFTADIMSTILSQPKQLVRSSQSQKSSGRTEKSNES